jgi:type VI secretion system secreted protein VgrG
VHAGEEVTVSSGLDTNIAVGRSLLASVAEKVSLFAANAGIKLFAAKGKVQVQAQSDDLDIIAEKSCVCCRPRLASRFMRKMK